MRVALAQVNPTVGAIEANARLVVDWMERARRHGADIVAFPELTLTGYPPEDLLFKPAFIEANLRALADVAAQSRGLTAVLGFVDKRDDIFNAAAVLHDGAHVGTYHKQYLPNYGVFDENRYFQSGTESPVFALGATVVAVNICEDIWYPTGPTTLQALAGAELVVTINASPYHAGKAQFREKMLATRAADDLVCLAFVNMVGGQDELIFDGQSFVFNEKGERDRAAAGPSRRTCVVADLDLDQVFRARLHDSRRRKEKLRSERRRRRAISLSAAAGARSSPPLPARTTRATSRRSRRSTRRSCSGTRDYVTKNGFQHVVIGLSGGIDSALVAAIACDALGPANVTGVTMPSPYSSAGTRRDAARLARNLGIEFMRAADHAACSQAYQRALAEAFKGLKEDVTEENLQARIRGNYLMALSNKFGWLVLTTGNKSEIAVGYSTLYGDMAGGFAVIKDVPEDAGLPACRARQCPGRPRADPAQHLRPAAVGRAPARPDGPGLAAALSRARRHPGGLRRGRPGRGGHRGPRLRRGHGQARDRHGRPERVQAPPGAHRHQDHPARLRQGLAPAHRQSLPGVGRPTGEPTGGLGPVGGIARRSNVQGQVRRVARSSGEAYGWTFSGVEVRRRSRRRLASHGLVEGLQGGEAPVDAVLAGHQLVVGPHLGDAAAVDHHDAVGVPHRRQAMGDDQGRATLHQLGQRLLDQELALGVEVGGGLVQDQDGRILQEGARDREALALAAGELHAALAHLGRVAVGQGGDEVVGLGQAAARSISARVAPARP